MVDAAMRARKPSNVRSSNLLLRHRRIAALSCCLLCLTVIHLSMFQGQRELLDQRAPVVRAAEVPRNSHADAYGRIYLVVDEDVNFGFFEDWVTPFIHALEYTTDVTRIDHTCAESAICTHFQPGDVVLLLQSSYVVKMENHVTYWHMNTEGRDKKFAEEALANGFRFFIDYSLANVEYLISQGAYRALWLPITTAPSPTIGVERKFLCMVGGANTIRRKTFYTQLKEVASREIEESIAFLEPSGWAPARDFQSQSCFLVVNLASVESNNIAPRLRLDVLWLYDIPIVSEVVAEPDMMEYNGSIQFNSPDELIDATLQRWRTLRTVSFTDRKDEYDVRAQILASRRVIFKRVVRTVLSYLGDSNETQGAFEAQV